MNVLFFIAKRIIGKRGKGSNISRPTINIAIAGVAIGIAVMLLTIAIVVGFQISIRDKVEGFNADILINKMDDNNSMEPSPIERFQPFLNNLRKSPGINHVQVYATKNGIIKTQKENEGVVLKGVGSDYDWTFIKRNLVKGKVFHPVDSVGGNGIIISKAIANELGADTGSKLFIFFVTRTRQSDTTGNYGYEQRVKTFYVKGIYHTGLDEFDRQVVFVDIAQIQNLNFWTKDQIGGFEVSCNNFKKVEESEAAINRIIGQELEATSIRKVHSAIFDWLDLQNTNAAIIIVLMVIVSAIAMISALIVLILENANMIGVLKALGMSNWGIQKIFIMDGAYLIALGLFFGNVAGLSLCWLQSHYGLVKLSQETYYISQVPIYLNWKYIVALNAGAFISCMLMLILPSFITSRIKPAVTLKYE
ncbi:MAG TPA: FtsX-like permease family protein [Bacteroidia bacterium]|nr:FtsX-like permease family protein [Bacteroidia bacterium]